jgi:hypothetical protein
MGSSELTKNNESIEESESTEEIVLIEESESTKNSETTLKYSMEGENSNMMHLI